MMDDPQYGEMDEYFDSIDQISSQCCSSEGGAESRNFHPAEDDIGSTCGDPNFHVWMQKPGSVQARRDNFMRWMFDLDPVEDIVQKSIEADDGDAAMCGKVTPDIRQLTLDDDAVPVSSCSDNGQCSPDIPTSEDDFECRNTNFCDGNERGLRDVGSGRMVMNDEFERSSARSNNSEKVRRRQVGWLRRLGALACFLDRNFHENDMGVCESNLNESPRKARVKVNSCRKSLKEFSAVYIGQDIKAHSGAILTMKFSPDGRFLATGGEDAVVRVWHVMECERMDGEVPEDNPSCIYFAVNHNSTLAPLHVAGEKKGKARSSRRTSDAACVVIPPEIFRISENPLHSFHGHDADVLDVSWSKNNYLLSSSMDKSVRLWRVGCDSCLRVFPHNNYVTCVQFNPVYENQFISGSIDGKVRIWEMPGCHVLDWTYIKEIVTAVCYRSDGKGVFVGSLSGNCLFYDAKGNHLQLEGHISFSDKKKSPCKRITGLQCSPNDPQKLMVTTADSRIRILEGVDLMHEYKASGLQNPRSQMPASFTANGRYIISAGEDANIYVWSHKTIQDPRSPTQAKTSLAHERFSSSNAVIAIPWNGFASLARFPVRDINGFTLSQQFLPKSLATWPEEKLPSSSRTKSTLSKSQFNFLKASCKNCFHAWGQVIVTAGWDGRIRSFHNYGLPVYP